MHSEIDKCFDASRYLQGALSILLTKFPELLCVPLPTDRRIRIRGKSGV